MSPVTSNLLIDRALIDVCDCIPSPHQIKVDCSPERSVSWCSSFHRPHLLQMMVRFSQAQSLLTSPEEVVACGVYRVIGGARSTPRQLAGWTNAVHLTSRQKVVKELASSSLMLSFLLRGRRGAMTVPYGLLNDATSNLQAELDSLATSTLNEI